MRGLVLVLVAVAVWLAALGGTEAAIDPDDFAGGEITGARDSASIQAAVHLREVPRKGALWWN